MVLSFGNNIIISVGQKIPIPQWDKYTLKYVLIYLLQENLYTVIVWKIRNTRKHVKHLGVLFFIDILRHLGQCRSPPIYKKIDRRER
jgi:hypothetical protein